MARVLTAALIEAVAVSCGHCDVDFWMPRYLYESRKVDGLTWYCPVGHPRVFANTSEKEQLLKQVADLAAARDFENQQRRSAEREAILLRDETLRLQKSVKRAKKRTANGVCPCCHRTVKQMAAHMKTKHPEYAKEASK